MLVPEPVLCHNIASMAVKPHVLFYLTIFVVVRCCKDCPLAVARISVVTQAVKSSGVGSFIGKSSRGRSKHSVAAGEARRDKLLTLFQLVLTSSAKLDTGASSRVSVSVIWFGPHVLTTTELCIGLFRNDHMTQPVLSLVCPNAPQ
jgi:hypothetical protein